LFVLAILEITIKHEHSEEKLEKSEKPGRILAKKYSCVAVRVRIAHPSPDGNISGNLKAEKATTRPMDKAQD